MALKNNINSAILFSLCYLINPNYIKAQNCTIETMPYKIYNLKGFGKIESLYDSIASAKNNTMNIVLVNSYGMVKKKEAYVLTIDLNKVIKASYLNSDTILFSKTIDGKGYLTNQLLIDSTANKFYYSKCGNASGTDKRSHLIICNSSSNIFIEYQSLDGLVSNTLSQNKSYSYLTYWFCLIKKVFSDFKMYSE